MRLKVMSIFTAATLLAPMWPLATIANAATPKKGAVCSKLGQSSGKGMNKLTCSPVTSLRWVSTPVKPAVGSIFAPAKMGQTVKVGSNKFSVKAIDFEIGTEICSSNPFNEGCVLGPKLQGLVDLNADVRWIAIDLELENGGSQSFTPSSGGYVFYLVQTNNELLENNIAAVFPQSFFDLRIGSDEKAMGKIVFSVPKAVDQLNPLLLMRDQSKSAPKDYYFFLDW